MKKVCFIIPHVFPVPAVKGGATEQLVTDFINMNEKYKKLDITIVTPYNVQAYEESKRFTATKFEYIQMDKKEKKVKDLEFNTDDPETEEYISKIKDRIDLNTFDHIIIEGGNLSSYKELLKNCDKKKCIAHIHGICLGNEEYESIFEYFIATSNYVANKLSENKIILPERVFTVYNGINTDKFKKTINSEEKKALREKYGIHEDDVVIMFCGRTVKGKGVKELLLALEKTKHTEKCKLLIIGNSNFGNEVITDYDKELYEISKRLPDKVKFTGFINNDELYKMHNISDISVVPSISEEAFGLVVVEAMSSGLPIIATKSGGIPEIIGDNSGILIEKDENIIKNIADSIDYLVENKEVRAVLSKAEKERAEKFNLDNYYNNFIDFFNKFDNIKNNKCNI